MMTSLIEAEKPDTGNIFGRNPRGTSEIQNSRPSQLDHYSKLFPIQVRNFAEANMFFEKASQLLSSEAALENGGLDRPHRSGLI